MQGVSHLSALTNYKPLRYTHIPVTAGSSPLLVADPWSYLIGFFKSKISKSRGDNRTNFQRGLHYINLAREFYDSYEKATFPTNTTLIYYGMLNLVKAFLSSKGVELETVIEHHGLSLPLAKHDVVEVLKMNDCVSIFGEFAKELGTPLKQKKGSIQLKDLFESIPELHSTYLNVYQECKQRHLPIRIDFLTDVSKRFLYTRLSYEKKYEDFVQVSRVYKNGRQNYFEKPVNESGWQCLYSKIKRRPKSFGNINQTYQNILQEYNDFDICSILTRQGYYYYCDLKPNGLHHLCHTFALMFLLGNLTRYRPTVLQGVFEGVNHQLISEAMAVCPRQFLYQISSFITKEICVLPYAKI